MITYHVEAFDEGYRAALVTTEAAAEPANIELGCKPGGCASIGCEGGIYCFNADGTRKAPADPEAVRKALAAALHPTSAPQSEAEAVVRLRRALYQIAYWPDGGNNYGQEKIKRFAIEILDGEPPASEPKALMLTDEQIESLWYENMGHSISSGRMKNDAIKFARNILRAASSEKEGK